MTIRILLCAVTVLCLPLTARAHQDASQSPLPQQGYRSLPQDTPAFAGAALRRVQTRQTVRPPMLKLAGPRFGITVLSGEAARIAREDFGLEHPVVTQFGWQFERRFMDMESGPSGVFEWVLLAGGLEQGKLFPSVSWLTGIRTPSGLEFGAGPNLTPVGLGLAAAAGVTIPSGSLNFPVNVAIVSSERGIRTSVLAGFTTRR